MLHVERFGALVKPGPGFLSTSPYSRIRLKVALVAVIIDSSFGPFYILSFLIRQWFEGSVNGSSIQNNKQQNDGYRGEFHRYQYIKKTKVIISDLLNKVSFFSIALHYLVTNYIIN